MTDNLSSMLNHATAILLQRVEEERERRLWQICSAIIQSACPEGVALPSPPPPETTMGVGQTPVLEKPTMPKKPKTPKEPPASKPVATPATELTQNQKRVQQILERAKLLDSPCCENIRDWLGHQQLQQNGDQLEVHPIWPALPNKASLEASLYLKRAKAEDLPVRRAVMMQIRLHIAQPGIPLDTLTEICCAIFGCTPLSFGSNRFALSRSKKYPYLAALVQRKEATAQESPQPSAAEAEPVTVVAAAEPPIPTFDVTLYNGDVLDRIEYLPSPHSLATADRIFANICEKGQCYDATIRSGDAIPSNNGDIVAVVRERVELFILWRDAINSKEASTPTAAEVKSAFGLASPNIAQEILPYLLDVN